MHGPIVKTPTSQHALTTLANKRASIRRNLLDVSRKGVLTPFPDVDGHVIGAKLVRCLLRYLVGVIAPTCGVVTKRPVDVVAAAVAKAVTPVRASARRVFPLGFGGQAKDRLIQ